MDLNIIKKLVKIVDTSEITDLEVEENGFKVKIAKNMQMPGGVNHSEVYLKQPLPDKSNQESAEAAISAKEQEQKIKAENYHEIRSPIVGTFYRSPAPDADAYVQVSNIISPGTVLCIVEAMKLMNEIESDTTGKIVKILVDNGKPVEYNQPLFLIDTSV